MRIADLFLAFPPFILVLALVAVLGPGVSSVTLALTAISWTEYARLVRAITLSELRRDYVTAARSLGATHAISCSGRSCLAPSARCRSWRLLAGTAIVASRPELSVSASAAGATGAGLSYGCAT
jgi:ABC-type methionine transport system permease subunit